ncbi:hypothetical protein [Vibrio owensii]|uniref:hypothetical protein n=1 Tax=Vibrio owensii TaxID=696485 RepID=UPI004067FA0A
MEIKESSLMRLTKAELVSTILQMNDKYDEVVQIAMLEASVAKDRATRDFNNMNSVLGQIANATGFKRELNTWSEFPMFLQFLRTRLGKKKRR